MNKSQQFLHICEEWVEIKPRLSNTARTDGDRGQTRSESLYDIFVKGERVKTVPTMKEARKFSKFVKAGGRISAYQLYRS
jgi:hypothetical protein